MISILPRCRFTTSIVPGGVVPHRASCRRLLLLRRRLDLSVGAGWHDRHGNVVANDEACIGQRLVRISGDLQVSESPRILSLTVFSAEVLAGTNGDTTQGFCEVATWLSAVVVGAVFVDQLVVKASANRGRGENVGQCVGEELCELGEGAVHPGVDLDVGWSRASSIAHKLFGSEKS